MNNEWNDGGQRKRDGENEPKWNGFDAEIYTI